MQFNTTQEELLL